VQLVYWAEAFVVERVGHRLGHDAQSGEKTTRLIIHLRSRNRIVYPRPVTFHQSRRDVDLAALRPGPRDARQPPEDLLEALQHGRRDFPQGERRSLRRFQIGA